jgi:hypothetical protein
MNHSWFYCIGVGIGSSLALLTAVLLIIWLLVKLKGFLDRFVSDDAAFGIILGVAVLGVVGTLITLACKGILE